MTRLTEALLDAVDWSAQRSTVGQAGGVPEAVRGLIMAVTEEAAEEWYWKLDNRVVVQGQLFSSALALGPVLICGLLSEMADVARVRVLELIFQIAAGEAHDSEVSAGHDLGAQCRSTLRAGRWVLYDQLLSDSPRVRATALEVVTLLDEDRALSMHISRALLGDDTSDEVRLAFERLGG